MKKVFVLLLLGGALIGAWFYWSPRAAARDLRNAAQTGDVEELQRLVDFPIVREHLKADLKISMMRSMDTTDQSGLGSALGPGFGGMMIDGLVNQVVSPSGIAALVRHGSVDTASTTSRPAPATEIRMGYRDWNTFVITTRDLDNPPSDTVNFVLRRRGMTWRLVRVTLPQLKLK
ncbi:MAG TPA: DUF2939 domain-containing protein [Gemmatimonadales bacterium]|nr:DUF2939 domain-containing protein [Gemmatimonadales bacterium]